jgi:CRISP-associated protein Cas1
MDIGPDLWQRVTTQDALMAAWYKVSFNKGTSGGDGVTISDFAANLFANITQLRSELLGGTYRTGPHKKLAVPKKKPGYRILTIPSIRDRIVHTSLASALSPILEASFEDSSFAYRPGRGVVQAVARIEQWRKRGYNIVIEADIIKYFDNIDHVILDNKLSSLISPLAGAPPVLALVKKILDDQGQTLGTPGLGIAQGSPLSPLLANLYLTALDEEIDAQGVKLVRFADDFVILCRSEKKAEKVLAFCIDVLEKQNLRLHVDGTRIVSFEKGFDFIGYLFVRTLALKEKVVTTDQQSQKPIKSSVTDEGIIQLEEHGSAFDPGKRVLYLLDRNHNLTRRNRSFSVLRQDGSELIAIPYRRVGRIEIGPGVDFDRGPVDLALEGDIEFSVIDAFGQTRGWVTSSDAKRASIHLALAKAVLTPDFRTQIAKRLVDARIRNQRTQLMRLNRDKQIVIVETALEALMRGQRKLPFVASVEEARGIEGAATASYWPALATLGPKSDNKFIRSRPARDPLNAAINYLTGILERDIRASIQSVCLLPGFAFLHGSRDRHDGLVYDLMEPFRAPLTEGLPIFLFNARRIQMEMFTIGIAGDVTISDEGRKALVNGYESAIAKRVNKPDGTGKLGWRAMMRFQAQSLVNAVVVADASIFAPYLMEA